MRKKQKNYNNVQRELEKKAQKRKKKRHPKMNVSGKSVFKLKEIIKRRKNN